MKKQLMVIASVLLLLILVAVLLVGREATNGTAPNMSYIGVAFGGSTVEEAKALIDRAKSYTNLFILQSGPISNNETATSEICNYATTSGLNIIVYFGDLDPRILEQKNLTWRLNWINQAKTQYGERFLGVYYYDERGGIYLDVDKTANNWHLPANATYDSVATSFERGFLEDGGTVALKDAGISIFCSDYALYWFDYRSGYDVVLAQVGWNHTLAKDIALVRGAANFQHKDWGVIITWKYNQTPYLDSGEAIYEQMRNSYEAGAKYITIFNYPYNSTYGIMEDEHFTALENLWNDIAQNRITQSPSAAEAVLMLPKNYGFGLRYAEDKIWGFWGPDENSSMIYDEVQVLLNRYGYSLDIAYEDSSFVFPSNYNAVYYWNSTGS